MAVLTGKKEMLALLKKEPRARERKNKQRAVARILLDRHPTLSDGCCSMYLAKILQEAQSLDRSWRKIMEERPDLRGSDYGHKTELVEEAKRELGYRV